MSAFLSELEFAIKHLPPTIPEDAQKEIESMVGDVRSLGPKVTDTMVRDAMIRIGMIEWPFRHAYAAMINLCCSHTEHDMFLKRIPEGTRKKYLSIGGADATLKEIMRSHLFEEKLTPEERQEVQTAAIEARLEMSEFMEAQITQRPKEYERMLEKAKQEQQTLDALIGQLAELAPIDQHWQPEIEARVEQMRLGWSIAEPDVTVGDVEKEIVYWKEMLTGGEAPEGLEAAF